MEKSRINTRNKILVTIGLDLQGRTDDGKQRRVE